MSGGSRAGVGRLLAASAVLQARPWLDPINTLTQNRVPHRSARDVSCVVLRAGVQLGARCWQGSFPRKMNLAESRRAPRATIWATTIRRRAARVNATYALLTRSGIRAASPARGRRGPRASAKKVARRPCHICTGTGPTRATSARAPVRVHIRHGWARSRCRCGQG